MKALQIAPQALRGLLPPLVATLAVAAGPVAAQSLDIGLNFAELDGWAAATGNDGASSALHLTGDFRTGPAHGVQLDLGGEVIDDGFLGQVDLHVYLAPGRDRKYGFFASLADMDDRELTIGSAGIEVLAVIGGGTIVEARAGAGMIHGSAMRNVDFVSVSGGISHAYSDRTSVFAQATLAEFDEAAISATGYEWLAGLRHGIGDGRIEITAAMGATGLWGRDSAPTEPVVMAGLTWRFSGARGQKRPVDHRAFGTWQPARPLLALGRF
ncbi:hypothetical protein [Ostreiculturibacter nitratireducens]|uniref:hypothetical protein n=1 Tax=Ostreiculturibacter nitratireducens TaxID=3075226 RepID=UPI0031B6041A